MAWSQLLQPPLGWFEWGFLGFFHYTPVPEHSDGKSTGHHDCRCILYWKKEISSYISWNSGVYLRMKRNLRSARMIWPRAWRCTLKKRSILRLTKDILCGGMAWSWNSWRKWLGAVGDFTPLTDVLGKRCFHPGSGWLVRGWLARGEW